MYPLLFPKIFALKNNYFKGIVAFLSFLSLGFSLRAQTIVEGTAKDFPNKTVVVYRYLDLFSGVKEKVGSSDTDSEGNFTLNFPLDKEQFLVFSINRINAEVLIEPNQSNQIIFNVPSKDTPRTYAGTITQAITNNPVDKNIESFDKDYAQFQEESTFTLKLKMASGKSFQEAHAESLKGFQVKNIVKSDSSGTKKIDSYGEQLTAFEEKIKSKYSNQMQTNTFFNDYVNYSLGKLELVNHSREGLYDKYLDTTLNYNNPAVVDFFSGFYHNLWEQESKGKKLISVLKNERNFYSLDTTAANIPYLKNQEIRHLALVNALYQAYNQKMANPEMILTILVREAKKKDGFSAKVATKYINKIIRYKRGVKLQDFKMLDKKENVVTLKDLEGKFVYINFFTSWCTSCEGEMYIMKNLKKKYGKEITFVSVNMDDNYKDFKNFLSKHRDFDWQFFYGPSEEEIMTIFNLQNIPTYVFIDAEGNWVSSSARAPSEGISNEFDLIMRKAYQAPVRYKVWDD